MVFIHYGCLREAPDRHRRERYLTEEVLSDLYNHDVHSRQAAREASDKYNNHDEHCNRAIEAGTGQGIAGSASGDDELKGKL